MERQAVVHETDGPKEPALATAAATPEAFSPGRFDTATLLSLQGSAGNQMVATLLARQPAAATAPGAPGAAASGTSPDAALIQYFADMWAEDPASVIRLGLEVLRPIPAIGLLTGVAADLIGAGADLMDVPTGSPMLMGFADATIVVRSGTNLVGNGVGQLLEIIQLAEAFVGSATFLATCTAVGIVADTITVPVLAFLIAANEVLTGVKLTFTTVTGLLDFIVSLEAAAGAVLGPREDMDAWAELMGGYIANQVGDIAGFVNEVAGGLSGGLTGSGAIGQVIAALVGIVKVAWRAYDKVDDWLWGFWNVVGGDVIDRIDLPDLSIGDPGGLEPAPGATLPGPMLARQADLAAPPSSSGPSPEWFAARLTELDAMRTGVTQGDPILDALDAQVAELMAAVEARVEESLGGADVVDEVREAMTTVLEDIEVRLGLLGDVGSQAQSGLDQITTVSDEIGEAIIGIEGLEMPQLDILKDVTGGETLQAGLDQFGEMMNPVKETLLAPLRETQAAFDTIREALEALLQMVEMVSAALEDATVQLGDTIAEADTLPEMIQAMLDACASAAGAAEGISFTELHQGWQNLNPALDQATARATAG